MEQPPDDFEAVGYFFCRNCGEPLMKGAVGTSRGLCSPCRSEEGRGLTRQRLRYEVEGRTYDTGDPEIRRNKKYGTRVRSEEQKAHDRLVWASRSAAMARLTTIYRPMFEILFAEEKAKRGIEAAVRWTSPHGTGVADAIRQAALEDLVEDLDDSVAYAAARQEDQRNRRA